MSQLSSFLSLDPVDLYFSRKHRRSLRTVTSSMHRTHLFSLSDIIDTSNQFPSAKRDLPVTFRIQIRRTGASPNGVVFEVGDATTGVAVYIDGSTIGFVAGGQGDDGVTLTVDALPATALVDITASVIPGTGEARLWINGTLAVRGKAGNTPFPDGWTAAADGKLGGVEGAVTARVPAGQRVTLTDVDIISSLAVYVGQFPRHFEKE